MLTIKLGFALEGNSDYPVIPNLTRRVIQSYAPDTVFLPESTLRPRKRGHGFVQELHTFARQLQDDKVDMIVAVVDTDNTRVNERGRLIQEAQQRCMSNGIATCIAAGLAVHALEAWLLADELALFNVFDGDRQAVQFPSVELELSPKAAINRIVQELTHGQEVSFVPFAADLVENIRLQILRQRCPHFDDFARNVTNCFRHLERIQNQPPAG
ncbi:MAG: hypothetical protein FD146_1783 [Anaerolineaceae bacterium]|nr:MAG: hypothetical protein FD146_1783 [Anaerolineaceae bacterium]